MIDLDQAARELTASVANVQPDLPRVRGIARRRQRRRRTAVSAAAALVLLAGGAAVLAATGSDGGAEQIHAGHDPGSGTPRAGDIVDYGDLRITVPDGWVAVATDAYPDGACGADGLILVGPEVLLPAACRQLPSIQIQRGATVGEAGPIETRSVGGREVQLTERTGGTEVWSVPSLEGRLTVSNGADPTAVLDSIEPSARSVALADADERAASQETPPTAGTKKVSFEGVSLNVPEDWPEIAHEPGGDQDDPCRRWARIEPTAVVGQTANPRCDPKDYWVPRDGAWLLPNTDLHLTPTEGLDTTVALDDLTVTEFGDHGTVLTVLVPAAGDRPEVVIRIGLGVDGHTAGSILSSIRVDPDPAITLPCGPTVTMDRQVLALPDDLNVSTLQGPGGTAPGTMEGVCAVNLTATDNPGRHITFSKGPLAYALGSDESREVGGTRQVRWGTIEDGFGGELPASGSDETIAVTAYGITEAEAQALFTSLTVG